MVLTKRTRRLNQSDVIQALNVVCNWNLSAERRFAEDWKIAQAFSDAHKVIMQPAKIKIRSSRESAKNKHEVVSIFSDAENVSSRDDACFG